MPRTSAPSSAWNQNPSMPSRLDETACTERREQDEEAGEEDEGDGHRDAHRLVPDALLFRNLLVRGPRERLHPERHRLGEVHDPAQQRDLAVLLGPARRVVHLDVDVTVGVAHRDGPGGARRASSRPRRRPGPPCTAAGQPCGRSLRATSCGTWSTGAGSARPDHRCPRASACPCRRGGIPSRARPAAPWRWSG